MDDDNTARPTGPATSELLTRSSVRGRLTIIAVTLGSAIGILDGTVVNVALKTIGEELHASLAQLQWVVNGYMLALASLVLVGGSLGDRLGRRRVYLSGIGLFAVASVACGFAQSPSQLIAFRVIQGLGAAASTPGALAIIQSSFVHDDRAPAIGTWAGWSGIAAAAGPLLGGWLVEHGGWRWIFWINVPLCVAVVVLGVRYVPESREPGTGHFDRFGAALTVLGLGALTYALTSVSDSSAARRRGQRGGGRPGIRGLRGIRGQAPDPLVPLQLFASRVFSAANAMTFLVYGAIGAVFLLLVLQLQVTSGFSPLTAAWRCCRSPSPCSSCPREPPRCRRGSAHGYP